MGIVVNSARLSVCPSVWSQRMIMTNHNEILHMSRQLHCRDVCKISLWSIELFYPSALRAGGVLSSRSGRAAGRPGGRLPNLRNPYLCNRLMDFLHSKFYGVV